MTSNPDNLPNRRRVDRPREVVFVAFQGVGLLDLTGPQTAFHEANRALSARGVVGYRLRTASLEGGRVTAAEGLTIETHALTDLDPRSIDTLVVPGSPDIVAILARSSALVEWLRDHATSFVRVASVCSGAFLLASAGLLAGKRAATHWAMCDHFESSFPEVEVDRDAIFVREGSVWTSAGVTTGIDLTLALIEADCGREVAMRVARELVMFLRRPGGQSQFSEVLRAQVGETSGFESLHVYIADHLRSDDLSVEKLAEFVHMSPRNFARVYKRVTGRTPAKSVELIRLEAARRLLEGTEKNVDEIARRCGFGDEERMRVTFQRNLGVSPRDYRRRFSR